MLCLAVLAILNSLNGSLILGLELLELIDLLGVLLDGNSGGVIVDAVDFLLDVLHN